MPRILRSLVVLLFYAGIFIVFTWPLAGNFATAFPAVPGHDSYQFYWNVWHFREAATTGHNPFVTDWLFYPAGSGLIMHAYIPIIGMLAVLVGNEMLAINLGLLASYALSGTGAYYLARRWVKNPVLGLLAGFIFAYSPYKLQRLPEHFNLVLTATVPFYVLAFLRAFEFREGRLLPIVRSRAAVLACCLLGIITLLSDYYVLFGLIYFSLLYASWYWLRIGRLNWRNWRTWAVLAGILLVSHIGIRLLRLAGVPDTGKWWGGDVVAFLLPPATSRWLDFAWAERLYNSSLFNMPGSIENTLFIGYALPLLALSLWLWKSRPRSLRTQDVQGRPLLWVLIMFLLFTVPTLRVYGHERLNLPTSLLHFIPFFNNIRCPTRWIMLVGLLLPIISFSALEAAWQGVKSSSRYLLSGVLFAVVALEFWPKPYYQATAASVPAFYRQLAARPGTTLIPIPLGVTDGNRQAGHLPTEQLFYQAFHRKKLPGGYLSRVKPDLFVALRQQPVLRALLQVQTHPDSLGVSPTPEQMRAFLQQYQPAAFVIDSSYRTHPVRPYLRQLLQPFGYTEQVVEQRVIFVPATTR